MSPRPVRVLCFGEALWDLFETKPGVFERHVGGASANVAIALSRLGVRAGLLAAVGHDEFGDALVARLKSEKVDTKPVVRVPKRTAVTFITRDRRGEPRFHNYREGAADTSLAAEHVNDAMARAAWILVGTSTPSSASLVDATLALLDRTDAAVLVDLNTRPRLWPDARGMRDAMARIVRRAHVVKASMRDLDEVAGKHGMAWLGEYAPHATWLLTDGKRGARARGAHGEVRVPAKPSRCVDATGAGDAFVAGAIAALLAQNARPGSAAWNDPAVWTGALAVGHDLGAKAVSRVGAAAGLTSLGAVRKRLDRLRRDA